MRTKYLGVLVGFVFAGFGSAGAAENCGLKPVSSIPIEISADRRIFVNAQIDGQPVKLLLELARTRSYLSASTTKKLGLVEQGGKAIDSSIREEDGEFVSRFVAVRHLNLGQLARSEQWAGVLSRVTDIDGIIGNNWFEGYDVEIDPARSRINLFAQDHCAGAVVYWADSFFTINEYYDQPRQVPLYIDVTLDGKPIRATLDTGKSETTLSAATAQSAFDVTAVKDGAQPKPAPSISGSTLMSFDHVFGALEIGPLRLPNKKVAITEFPRFQEKFLGSSIAVTDDRAELRRLMLGMDVLSRLHLFISYREQKIYFTLADERKTAGGDQNASAPPPRAN